MLKLGSFLKLEKVSTFTVKSTDLGKISIPSHNERANFESTVWHVENSEVARGLNALRCKVEVDKLEWMNMRKGRSFGLAARKKRGGDKRPIKCLALFRRLGAVAHLPTTNITQLRLCNWNNCKYVLRKSKLDFLTRSVQWTAVLT